MRRYGAKSSACCVTNTPSLRHVRRQIELDIQVKFRTETSTEATCLTPTSCPGVAAGSVTVRSPPSESSLLPVNSDQGQS